MSTWILATALAFGLAGPATGAEPPSPTDPDAALKALREAAQVRDAGDADGALRILGDALARHPRDAYREVLIRAFGRYAVETGDSGSAVQRFLGALPLWRELGRRREEARTLVRLGLVFHALGDDREAIDCYARALPIARALKDRGLEAAILNDLGGVHHALGEPQAALQHLERALSLRRAARDLAGEAATLGNIGVVYDALGDEQQALAHLERALSTARAGGYRRGEATALNNLGAVLHEVGEHDRARAHLERAAPIAREAGDRRGEATTLSNLMVVAAGDSPDAAVLVGKLAVGAFQTLADVPGRSIELQRSLVGSVGGVYRWLADLLASRGRLAEARQVLVLLKEQETRELLGGDEQPTAVALLPAERAAVEHEERIGARLVGAGEERAALLRKRSLAPEEKARLATLDDAIEQGRAEFQDFLEELSGRLAASAGDGEKVAAVREAEALMGTLGRLGPGTVAVYTVVVEGRLRTILVTSQVERTYALAVDANALGRMVLAFRAAIQERRDPRPAAKALHDVLVAPIAADLEDARAETIMWWLDGALRYAPIAALYDGERWLVERYRTAVFTLGSLSRLERAPRRGWEALGLGVTRAHELPGVEPGTPTVRLGALPGVKAELEGIVREEGERAGVLPGRRRLDEDFTRESLRLDLSGPYALVHVASHFSLRPADPSSSFLLLGDGTRLTLRDFQRLAQLGDVDLLTLSACDTAVGGSEDGREIDALAIVAQRKGAAAVLATLWRVEDASAAAFMKAFYRLREDGRVGKAEALREAQLAFLRGTIAPDGAGASRGVEIPGRDGGPPAGWTHPYHWAPFVLVGNWR